MSQFPGDEGSKFLAGTLGGPGYGEFPLGSAGPRIDPRDPRYIPPPQPGSGTNLDGLESLLRMPNPGFDGDMIPHPQPPRMDVGEPVRPPLGSIVARPGIMPGEMDFPRPRFPDPMPRFPEPTPMPRPMPGQPDQRMPPRPPGAGSLFDTPDKNDYNRLLANAYQDQYRNAPSPYAAQADYLMNRPVFDRGPRTDDPMFAFRAKDDPFAAMRRQQPVRDEANAAAAAAAKAQQDKLAADEAAAAQAALDATTAEEAAAAKAEQERIAAEKAIAAQAETDRVAAEAAAAQAAETAAAAAAQEEAAAAAAATQAAAEAESLRIAQEAEAQRQAALQARLDAMEGQFGDFTGRFGNFDPATIQANIAAAQAASAANAATIADTPAVDPDLAARIAEMQGQFGDFSGILDGFDPAALQANIAAAQASADANSATIADTPAVNPDLAARIAEMQGQFGDFSGRFNNFDPAALRAQIEGLSLGDGAGIGNEGGATAPGFVAPTDRTVQKSREGIVNRDLGGMDKDAIRARIEALQGGTPSPKIDPESLFSDPGLGGGRAPTPAPRVDNPRVMPGPVPGPAPVVPRPGTVPKPKIDPDSLFSDPGLGGGPVPRPGPAPRVDNPRVMPAPVPGPAPVVPSAPSGDFQSNVDFMNQMATKNAQVGSDGQAVMPSFTYDAATNEYVRDSSAFGLTGDAAITRYSPEEFQQEFGRTLSKQGSAAPKPKTMPKSAPKVIAGPKPKVIVDPVNPKPKPVPRGKITDRRKAKRGRR